MLRESLIFVGTCDIAGHVRGKGFPARELDARRRKGVGWTHSNLMQSAFGDIFQTPFGTGGDLMIVPDPDAAVNVDFEDGSAPEHFMLGDIRNTDGTPWECCPRSYLIDALARLEAEHGLRLIASFEHEFTVTSLDPRPGSAYGLDAILQIGDLPDQILRGLDDAGLGPETFLPEYSPGQFEFTLDPAPALLAADRAVLARQVVRAVATACARASTSCSRRRWWACCSAGRSTTRGTLTGWSGRCWRPSSSSAPGK